MSGLQDGPCAQAAAAQAAAACPASVHTRYGPVAGLALRGTGNLKFKLAPPTPSQAASWTGPPPPASRPSAPSSPRARAAEPKSRRTRRTLRARLAAHRQKPAPANFKLNARSGWEGPTQIPRAGRGAFNLQLVACSAPESHESESPRPGPLRLLGLEFEPVTSGLPARLTGSRLRLRLTGKCQWMPPLACHGGAVTVGRARPWPLATRAGRR
jgi:hypothetical protein